MSDLARMGNIVEAAVWFACSVAMMRAALRGPRRERLLAAGLAVAFALFGVSDLIETRTGAWWRPPWLLVWNAICVVALIGGLWRYRRRRAAARSDDR